MAKDDYHVIVYNILAYLYQCLKHGEKPDESKLRCNGKFLDINETYWKYIFKNIYEYGFITGIIIDKNDNGHNIYRLDMAQITPTGIEYLTENSTMQKAKKFFKDTAEVLIPLIK